MNKYWQPDPWCIIEESFNPDDQLESESVFALANGHIGQRGSFEEYYSRQPGPGSYISGVCYQESDDSLVKQLDVPNWNGIIVRLNDEMLDLATWDVENFRRVLNMREGFLERTFDATSPKGRQIQVSVKQFLSMAEKEVGAFSYSVKSLNFEGRVSFTPIIDANITDRYSSDNEQLWNMLQVKTQQEVSHLWAHARRMNYLFCGALTYVLYKNNEQLRVNPTKIEKERVAGFWVGTDVKSGDTVCLNKYVAIIDSLSHSNDDLTDYACSVAINAKKKGWNKLLEENSLAWAGVWAQCDGAIDGSDTDVEAQQKKLYLYFRKITRLDCDK